MKVRLTNGKTSEIEVRPSKYPLRSESACRSGIQYAIGQLILEKYPFDPILEDVPVTGENFYLDFFLPRKKIAFEIQGRQHNEYVPFFHGSKEKFVAAQYRDTKKAEFCRINDIILHQVSTIDEAKEILWPSSHDTMPKK